MAQPKENPVIPTRVILHSMLQEGCPDLVDPLNDIGRMVRDAQVVTPNPLQKTALFDILYFRTTGDKFPSEIRISKNKREDGYIAHAHLYPVLDGTPRHIAVSWNGEEINGCGPGVYIRIDGCFIDYDPNRNHVNVQPDQIYKINKLSSPRSRQVMCSAVNPIFGYKLFDIFPDKNLLLMTLEKPDHSEKINIAFPVALKSFKPEAFQMMRAKA